MKAERLYEFICDHCQRVYHDTGPMDSCPSGDCPSYDVAESQEFVSISWDVHVVRDDQSIHIGRVEEPTLEAARIAALSEFGVEQDDLEAGEIRPKGPHIYPDECFEVTPA